jgi:3-methyladenine DNA glycosylase/8-oxoguanine DNA glycosylase
VRLTGLPGIRRNPSGPEQKDEFITLIVKLENTMQLHQIHRFALTIPEPFDFTLTVAKPAGWHWSTPGEVFLGGTLWTGMHLRETSVGLKLSARKNRVSVTVFGRKPLETGELRMLKEDLWSALGGDEDLEGFYRFARGNPILSTVVGHLRGMRTGGPDDLFGDVILAILLQMAPMARSSRMMGALLDHYGRQLAFDGKKVTLWPTAAEMAKVDPKELWNRTKIGYRAERLVKAARFLKEHPLPLRDLSSLPEDEAVKRLREIPGVGPYSAGIILGTFPLDVWSVVIFSELFLGKTPESSRADIPDVVARLTGRFGKWRWLVFVYVLQDLPYLKEKYHLSRVT